MNGDLRTTAGRSDLVRLALRLIVEEALEGEAADALGRERYERGLPTRYIEDAFADETGRRLLSRAAASAVIPAPSFQQIRDLTKSL